jgi:uncharacterized membrane protein YkoI
MKHFTFSSMIRIAFSFALIANSPNLLADINQMAARQLSDSGQILTFEKIQALAQAIKPGRILEVELEKKRGRYVYEVELLDNNDQVGEVKLDAKTGKLIKLEIED